MAAGRPALKEEQKKKSVAKTITFQEDVVLLLENNYPNTSWSKVINVLIKDKCK